MFSGEKVLEDLRCDNTLMKTMVDRFGEDVTTLRMILRLSEYRPCLLYTSTLLELCFVSHKCAGNKAHLQPVTHFLVHIGIGIARVVFHRQPPFLAFGLIIFYIISMDLSNKKSTEKSVLIHAE